MSSTGEPEPRTDDRVSLAPFAAELRGYDRERLRRDLQAGVTVAVFAIPQAMAYAMLAGVPPVNGLYAAVIMSIVAALWGSSRHVNTGPTNSAALLTGAAMLAVVHDPDHLRYVFTFTLMVGMIRLAMGLCRLGGLVRLVPDSGFLGFTVGAGTLIAIGQLHYLLNVDNSPAAGAFARCVDVLGRVGDANPRTIAIGLAVFAFAVAFDRYARRWPVTLVAIALATGVAALAGAGADIRLVRDVAPVIDVIPSLTLPLSDPGAWVGLFPAAVAVAVVGLVEAVSIGQALALKRGESLNFNQEFVGQGASHVVGAFFGGLPGSGSFSRSVLIEQSGGETRLANVFFGLATAALLIATPAFLNRIPVCALSGLLLFIGYKLIDHARIGEVWKSSRAESAIMIATFIVTVFIRIEYGIFVAMLMAPILRRERT